MTPTIQAIATAIGTLAGIALANIAITTIVFLYDKYQWHRRKKMEGQAIKCFFKNNGNQEHDNK